MIRAPLVYGLRPARCPTNYTTRMSPAQSAFGCMASVEGLAVFARLMIVGIRQVRQRYHVLGARH